MYSAFLALPKYLSLTNLMVISGSIYNYSIVISTAFVLFLVLKKQQRQFTAIFIFCKASHLAKHFIKIPKLNGVL